MAYQRANTDWMKGNFGLSVHWTQQTAALDGTDSNFEQAVEAFDADTFAATIADAGAKHCIFTLTHALQYLALPCPPLDAILPGRTVKRDLIGDIISALSKRGIRFIAYYNHSCNGNDDPEWEHACGYASGIHGNLDVFAQKICAIVEFIARRYESRLAGWWFDSSYSLDPKGPHNSITCEMGNWQFPWAMLSTAAKAGNPNCAVTFNAGVASKFLYTECQDYYAGESVELDRDFRPDKLLQDHRWICIDSPDWIFSRDNSSKGFLPLRFPEALLKEYTAGHLKADNMITFNIQIDRSGKINPAILRELHHIIPD